MRNGRHDAVAPGTGARRPRSGIVTFHGGKGGVGTTTFAAESAAMLSEAGFRVAAIDLDLCGGDLHYRLDTSLTRGTHSVCDLLPVIDELDHRTVGKALTRCPCGAGLLPAAVDPPRMTATREQVERLLSLMAKESEFVIVDTAPGVAEHSLAALSRSDLRVFVTSPEVSSVAGLRRCMDLVIDVPASRLTSSLLMNRALGRRGDALSVEDTGAFLGLRVENLIYEDSFAFRFAADNGRTVACARSSTGRSMSRCIEDLFGLKSRR